MAELDLADIERRMVGAVDNLKSEFGGLRTGRASASLMDPIMVDCYGSQMTINQVASVNVPEARLITIQVWDKANVTAVEKAIRSSSLGLNPASDGQLVRVPIPELTEERRRELGKVAAQYAEQARVAVRNVRRHAMDELKHMERDGEMSEDDHHLYADEVQDLTDKTVARIDEVLDTKQKEIMQV